MLIFNFCINKTATSLSSSSACDTYEIEAFILQILLSRFINTKETVSLMTSLLVRSFSPTSYDRLIFMNY